MKTFMYIRDKQGFKLELTVYRIVKNEPIWLGALEFNTQSYKGDDTSVMQALARQGRIQAKYKDVYYSEVYGNKDFRLYGVG